MSRTPTEGSKPLPDPYDFSLVLGDALELLVRRILVISLFVWLSLLIRSILGGRAWGDAVRVPFLVDIEVTPGFCWRCLCSRRAEPLRVHRARGRPGYCEHRGRSGAGSLRSRDSVSSRGLTVLRPLRLSWR